MKRSFLSCAVIVAALLLLFAFSRAEAQRGGGRLGGGGPRPAAARPAGGGSVVHRNFTPPAGVSRPNPRPTPSTRPSPSASRQKPDFPKIPDRPSHFDGDKGRRPTSDHWGERGDGHAGRGPSLPDRPKRPDGDRPHIDRPDRPGHDGPGHGGPDWKHWPKIDPGKIHHTVINKIDIDKRTVVNVRNHFKTNYTDHHFWSHDWFKRHPGTWRPIGPPPPPPFWWHHPTWHHTWGWFAAGFFVGTVVNTVIEPVPYNYGNNIVYEGETVYINGVPYVSADEYYRQARDLAEVGDIVLEQTTATATTGNTTEAKAEDAEWLPMGTFAIVADDKQTDNKRIVQIATNKQGQVRGNIVDLETDKALELYGSVDSKSQRVAFKVRGHDDTVAECGLWNLTQETVPLLVHIDQDRTEERTLVRLHEKEDAETEIKTDLAP